MKDEAASLSALKRAVDLHAAKNGRVGVELLRAKSELLIAWLHFLELQRCGVADELLSGARVCILQTAAAVYLGLPGSAIAQLRTQIDVIFGWLYYKDHRIEWTHAGEYDDRWQLKGGVEDYLKEFDKRWLARMKLLEPNAHRSIVEPYRHLSALVHMQTSGAILNTNELSELVDNERCLEVIELQYCVSEYVSDVLASYFADDWATVPVCARADIDSRLSVEARVAFHSVDDPRLVAQRRQKRTSGQNRVKAARKAK